MNEAMDSYSRRLRIRLQNFRKNAGNSLSIEFLTTSVLAVLDPLLDDLDLIDDMRLRSKIAQLCWDLYYSNIVPRKLYMVCFIRALGATFSQIDDDALISLQGSLLLEWKEAIHRYTLMTGSDWNSQVDLGLEIY